MTTEQIRHKVDHLGIHTEFAIRNLIEHLYTHFYVDDDHWEHIISEPVKQHMRTRLKERYDDLTFYSLYDFLECTSLGEAINILLDNFERFKPKLTIKSYGQLRKLLSIFRRDIRNDFIAHPKRNITIDDFMFTLQIAWDIYNLCPEYMGELKSVIDTLFKEHLSSPASELAFYHSLANTYYLKAMPTTYEANWQEEYLDIALDYLKKASELNYCDEQSCDVRDEILCSAIKHYMNSEQSYKAMEWINFLLTLYEIAECTPVSPTYKPRVFKTSGYKMVYVYLNKSKTHFYTSRKSRLAPEKKKDELALCYGAFERALCLYNRLAEIQAPFEHLSKKIEQIREKIGYEPIEHRGTFSVNQPSLKGVYIDCHTCGKVHFAHNSTLPPDFSRDELDHHIDDCTMVTCSVLKSYKTPFRINYREVAEKYITITSETLQPNMTHSSVPETSSEETYIGTICDISKNILFFTRDGKDSIFCHPNDIINFRYLSHTSNRNDIIYDWFNKRQQFRFSIIYNEIEERYEAINAEKLIFPAIDPSELPPLPEKVLSPARVSLTSYKEDKKVYTGTILTIRPNGTLGLTRTGYDSIFCHLNDIPELNDNLGGQDRNVIVQEWYNNAQQFSFCTRFNYQKKRMEAYNVHRL